MNTLSVVVGPHEEGWQASVAAQVGVAGFDGGVSVMPPRPLARTTKRYDCPGDS